MEAFLSFVLGGLPWWSLLVICPLLFLAGFVDAIGGGGGLISLPAYLFCGLPAHNAIGTNKMSSTMGTTVATLKYMRSGYMDWPLCGACAITALAGSTLGANLALLADDFVLKVFMLIAIPIVGFYVLKTKNLEVQREAFERRRTFALAMAIAFSVGIYDGFYGPGTGTFLILLLTGVAHLDIYKAAGTTKAINLSTNVAALVVFLANGTVYLGLGLLGGLFNIAGNYLGARSFTKNGAAIVRPIVLVVLGIFAVRLILEFAGVV